MSDYNNESKLAKFLLLYDTEKEVIKNLIVEEIKVGNHIANIKNSKNKYSVTLVISDVLNSLYNKYNVDLFFDDVKYDGSELKFLIRKNKVIIDDNKYFMDEEDWNFVEIYINIMEGLYCQKTN